MNARSGIVKSSESASRVFEAILVPDLAPAIKIQNGHHPNSDTVIVHDRSLVRLTFIHLSFDVRAPV